MAAFSISLPTVTAIFDGLDKFENQWVPKQSVVMAGVQTSGPATAYALVWEWGNRRQHKQGPRTVKGTNPDGESVWLSSQAPEGYIRVNEPRFWKALADESRRVDFGDPVTKSKIEKAIRGIVVKSAYKCRSIIANSAPVDTGALKASIKIVFPGNQLLGVSGNRYQTFDMAPSGVSGG